MDAETQRRKRQEALEEKKKRLEEMRKTKQSKEVQSSEAVFSVTSPTPPLENKVDVDDLVKNLLTNPSVTTVPVPPTLSVLEAPAQQIAVRRPTQLVITKNIACVHILPTLAEHYDKECQTEQLEDSIESGSSITKTPSKLERRRPPPTNIRVVADSLAGTDSQLCEDPKAEILSKVFSESEKLTIMASDGFCNFVASSCRIIDRALVQSSNGVDLLRDYGCEESMEGHGGKLKHLNVTCTLEDESVRGRPVMDLHFNQTFPELFLASYGSKSSRKPGFRQEDDPPGMICVWNSKVPTSPEARFSSSSPILTARFHGEGHNLIVGGCYSGQLLLWDMRAKALLPVQRSAPSGRGHKHPVYGLVQLGQSDTDVVSVSTDGIICHWDLARLNEPTNVVNLQGNETGSSTAPLVVTSMALGQEEVGSGYRDVFVGTGSGVVFRRQLPSRSTDNLYQIGSHGGPITSMHVNEHGTRSMKGLLLTASVDWTVKLWRPNGDLLLDLGSSACDYVSDVRWNVANPALFASVCSGGAVNLWHLGRTTQEPIEQCDIMNAGSLTRCEWNGSGSQLCVATSKGGVNLMGVNESLLHLSSTEESNCNSLIFNE